MVDTKPSEQILQRSKTVQQPWRVLTVFSLLACLPTLLALAARLWWVLELMTHFRVYYAGFLLPATALFLLGRKWVRALVCGTVLSFNFWLIVPIYLRTPTETTAEIAVRCLVVNVHTANRNYEQFLTLVREENPDLLVVIEVNRKWMKAISVLENDYPHTLVRPREDNFGIAYFSRLPATSLQFQEFGGSEVPSVVAKLDVEGNRFTLIGTHTLPPVNSAYAQTRNEHLRGLGESVRDIRGPLIICGDLNMTSWSPYFSDLIAQTGLRDSRRGFGIQPTWTGGRWFMRLPLDHVLVSSQIAVVDRRVGKYFGSDHLPVIVDLRIGSTGNSN